MVSQVGVAGKRAALVVKLGWSYALIYSHIAAPLMSWSQRCLLCLSDVGEGKKITYNVPHWHGAE